VITHADGVNHDIKRGVPGRTGAGAP